MLTTFAGNQLTNLTIGRAVGVGVDGREARNSDVLSEEVELGDSVPGGGLIRELFTMLLENAQQHAQSLGLQRHTMSTMKTLGEIKVSQSASTFFSSGFLLLALKPKGLATTAWAAQAAARRVEAFQEGILTRGSCEVTRTGN